MANLKLIKWLQKGVNSWDTKRSLPDALVDHDFLYPDLSGVDLFLVLQKSVYEKRVGFFGTGFILDDINLKQGLFQDTKLSGFSFRKANLEYANFERALLLDSDLHSAKLNGANLTDADLSHSNLEDAELRKTILTGTNFTNTQPWKSKLFPDLKNELTVSPDSPKEVKGIEGLLNLRQFLKDYYEKSLEGTSFNDGYMIYFRGEEKDCWKLRPYIMRDSSKRGAILRDKEGEMLLDLMSQRPEDFIGATSALSQWVMAQHHGLRTRLLDITRNPLVALFHACKPTQSSNNGILHVFVVPKDIIKTFDSDAVSVVTNLAKLPRSQQDRLMGVRLESDANPFEESVGYSYIMGRLYHYIRQEKPHFKERINVRDFFRAFVIEPQQSFERIRVQSGAFLISAFHKRFEPEEIREFNKDTPVYHHYKVTVPADSKDKILDKLKFLNITREVLFPGLDEAAEAVMKRYEERNSRKME